MAITANSQALQFSAPSLIPNPDPVQLFEDTAWLWAPLFEDVTEEAPTVYLSPQDGSYLADTIHQQQRQQWGIDYIPPGHPSSSALAQMMEQLQHPTSPEVFSEASPTCYPTPLSLVSEDSPSYRYLPDIQPDNGFESIPPDRDNYPPRRKTSFRKNCMLAGHARAGATSSAIDSVEAHSTNRNLFDQPSGVGRKEVGAAAFGAAPSRSSSPSIIPTSFSPSIESWAANDSRMSLPSPAATIPSPITSPITRSPSPPSFEATVITPSTAPSQGQKRRRNDEDVTEKTQPEKKRKMETKNKTKKPAKSNKLRQQKVRKWAYMSGEQDNFRNVFWAAE